MTAPSLMIAVSLWHWFLHLRSLGLIAVGIADNSVIPMPGNMDVLTIWLAASERQCWSFYAFMATVGGTCRWIYFFEVLQAGAGDSQKQRSAGLSPGHSEA